MFRFFLSCNSPRWPILHDTDTSERNIRKTAGPWQGTDNCQQPGGQSTPPMNPRILHQEAMQYSFRAKKELAEGDDNDAFELYARAAELESQVARFYFDKPDLEPTRSVMVRSAAFLNLKAGRMEEAQQLIFWGLLNLADEGIRAELNDALSRCR